MDIIQNKDFEPDMYDIEEYITGEAKIRWQNIIKEIESIFKVKPKIAYSNCSAKPGYNIKYKKNGKALCTLYPEKEGFVALVVLGYNDMEIFNTVRRAYTEYINKLYDSVRLFNGTKWIMINVSDQYIADDVLKLLHLKLETGRAKQ